MAFFDRFVGLRLSVVLIAVFCFFNFQPSAAETEKTLEQLLSKLDSIRLKNRIAGVGLLLVSPNQVDWVGGLGVEDWDSQKSMSADSLVRIGSITKTFTGLTALRLKHQGLLDFDQAIEPGTNDFLYRNPWNQAELGTSARITIAQLLEHTAGLKDLSSQEFNYPTALSLKDALAVEPDSRKLAWPPGIQSSYSNSGAGVAAYTIEQHTGLNFEKYSREQVWLPLGMLSAGMSDRPGLQQELVTGYNTDGKTKIPYWHTLYRPFGGLHVKLKEMSGPIQMFLNRGKIPDGRFLTQDEIRRSEIPQTTAAARAGLEYGYGFGNYHSLRDGFLFHGHGGDADGYLAHFAYSSELGRGYFIVINAFQGSSLRAMRKQVEQYLIGGHQKPAEPPIYPARNLKRYIGVYRQSSWRFGSDPMRRVELTLDRRGIRVKDLNAKRYWTLIPTAENLFRRPGETVATAAILEENGNTYLQTGFGNFEKLRPQVKAVRP